MFNRKDFGRKLPLLSLENKILIYKVLVNLDFEQLRTVEMQFKILRSPWYILNHTLHTDLKILYINEVIKENIIFPIPKRLRKSLPIK